MLLLKAPFLPPVISLDDILRSIATNYFENYVTWKSKPLHVLSCEDINLNLINLFILKLSFIPVSVLLFRSWSCISEVWCTQMISQCSFTSVIVTRLRRGEKKIEVRDMFRTDSQRSYLLKDNWKSLSVTDKMSTEIIGPSIFILNHCGFFGWSGFIPLLFYHMGIVDNSSARHGWKQLLHKFLLVLPLMSHGCDQQNP